MGSRTDRICGLRGSILTHRQVRVLMAKMGFRNMDELIGHAEAPRLRARKKHGW